MKSFFMPVVSTVQNLNNYETMLGVNQTVN